jgi:hypothetical protein
MLGVCLAAVSGLAQDAAQAGPTADEASSSTGNSNSFSLSGTVLNSLTGEPVRRAAVQISGQNGRIALTDAGGHFLLEGLAEGDVYLAAMKPGFFPEMSNTTLARVGKDAPAVVLKLTPSAVISGRVSMKDEQPLEGFQIRVFSKQNQAGRLVWAEQPNQGRTNEEGEFRIAELQAGAYYLAVDQSQETILGQKGVPNAREQVFTRMFYPGVSEMRAATPIEALPGEEATANFTLSAEPVYAVSGSLTGQAGGVATVTFERRAGDDADFKQTLTPQSGKFEAKVPAGSYGVSAETTDGKGLVTPGAVVIRADEANLQLALSPAVGIPVDIVKEQGGAGSERIVAAPRGIPGLTLELDPVSELWRGANVWNGETSSFADIAPGTYRLEVRTPAGWWVKSAQSGGIDLLREDLTVVEGEHPGAIEVTVRDGAGMVSGTVTPAADPLQVLVLLVQPRGVRNFVRAATVLEGTFSIEGVPPGHYAILALDGAAGLEYANPQVLEPYLSEAEPISVPARGTVTVNLGITAVGR